MLQEGKWGSALTQIVHTMGDRKIIDWLIANVEYSDQGQNIYVVPFSLDPESWKPTGSINFSRLDDVKLTLSGMNKPLPGSIHVYARNFNVLTVSNGMAGKRYAS
eukprot:jgi/Mesvir1/16047/Mv08342-RA.1